MRDGIEVDPNVNIGSSKRHPFGSANLGEFVLCEWDDVMVMRRGYYAKRHR